MYSRYDIFCKVVETGSFTKAANELGYTQSAVSQNVMSLEKDFQTALLFRSKEGITLTKDGKEIYPYIQAISNAEADLERKKSEMQGLEATTISIGAFTSVSRQILPPIMAAFKEKYPTVEFIIKQGDYVTIPEWIANGEVDLGFIEDESSASSNLESDHFMTNELVAVVPADHPLSNRCSVSVKELLNDPFIMMHDGRTDTNLKVFRSLGLQPNIGYKIYDDYTIIAMIRQGLGISLMFKNVVDGFDQGVSVIPLVEHSSYDISLAWRNSSTLPYAAKKFMDYLLKNKP